MGSFEHSNKGWKLLYTTGYMLKYGSKPHGTMTSNYTGHQSMEVCDKCLVAQVFELVQH
jgi:hypothetical protein